jgi:tRNA(Ile)-lysidine synthase
MPDQDNSPISAQDAKRLFAHWKGAPALVLAVSGGPDSIALMWLAARWRRALARGPRLIAVTVDHGLRAEAQREALEVKRLARSLELPHRTLRWTGTKPKTGLPAAAREARYRLLAQVARKSGASHILTAHTRDDQAETLLMRLLRGSGIAGLAAMAREAERDGVMLARPFLDVSKAQLMATLNRAKVGFADDPTNRDVSFTRPRLRSLMPALAAEGGDARSLARLASRLARANAAVEVLVEGAERYLALRDRAARQAGFDGKESGAGSLAGSFEGFDAETFETQSVDPKFVDPKPGDAKAGDARSFDAECFAGMPDEIRLRLLLRAINRFGHEGPAELGKAEVLLAALDRTVAEYSGGRRPALKQTLAGALVTLVNGRIRVGPAPARRRRIS